MKNLPIERLRELFDLVDGSLFWKATGRGRKNKKAGTNSHEYRVVGIDGHSYMEHRVVFAMANGRWPQGEVDHINSIRSDNRPENLRESTKSQNQYNRGASSHSKTGIKGVSRCSRSGKWLAQITVNKRRISLGVHEDIALAAFIYECAALKYQGSFAKGQPPNPPEAKGDNP